ncbi:uncharacterized protein ASPGLDRAFT_47347 [Aspergillus glaucus CBS 516.65]|uniref:Uncharacterized protein n=1 Tax=Aspergillus glaucus CBS 516.65 TaxID=1160497 RepID=A0A1L9VIE1_ASPGL|nr:hypothetical protein ASPGLDRAFT_47347 [Aspergillus glaucus CBS 516.65]OJJ83689.1 hypothetical protein ASPGLDRAFT_47347 [Aspergillus glaucus CBS 516.65]
MGRKYVVNRWARQALIGQSEMRAYQSVFSVYGSQQEVLGDAGDSVVKVQDPGADASELVGEAQVHPRNDIRAVFATLVTQGDQSLYSVEASGDIDIDISEPRVTSRRSILGVIRIGSETIAGVRVKQAVPQPIAGS